MAVRAVVDGEGDGFGNGVVAPGSLGAAVPEPPVVLFPLVVLSSMLVLSSTSTVAGNKDRHIARASRNGRIFFFFLFLSIRFCQNRFFSFLPNRLSFIIAKSTWWTMEFRLSLVSSFV